MRKQLTEEQLDGSQSAFMGDVDMEDNVLVVHVMKVENGDGYIATMRYKDDEVGMVTCQGTIPLVLENCMYGFMRMIEEREWEE